MMKRFAAVFLCILCAAGAALAEDSTFATYQLPDGADVCLVQDAVDYPVPDGLAPMYDLMQNARQDGYVYLMRMPNGRALASVSCTWLGREFSNEALLERWPQIRENLEKEAKVTDEPSVAIERYFGVDLLHISASLSAGENHLLPLQADGYAFCAAGELYEVWTVHPQQALYLLNPTAYAELSADREALDFFRKHLYFGNELPSAEGVDYTDPEGHFTVTLPADSVIITSRTAAQEVAEVRQRFVSANSPGADNAFDQFMADVYELKSTLVLTDDMKGALLMCCTQNPDLAGVTTSMLSLLAEPTRESLNERFGKAVKLEAEGSGEINGVEHVSLGYWVSSGECDLQLDILVAILGENWLCETDIFSIDGDMSSRMLLSSFVLQTLSYQIP